MIEQLITIFMFAATVNMVILLILSVAEKLSIRFDISIPNWMIRVLCPKCISFWLLLFISGGNILIAGTSSLFAYLIDKYLI